MYVYVCVLDSLTGSRPEDDLMGLASGPWGVEYRLWALCSATVVLQIWVKYPAGTDGLHIPVLKNSVFTPPAPAANIFIFCGWEQGRPEAGDTPLGIRIILLSPEYVKFNPFVAEGKLCRVGSCRGKLQLLPLYQ